MDTTIDELRAGWEQVREQVKQLADENRAMRDAMAVSARDHLEAPDAVRAKDELLWWVTALAWVEVQPDAWLNAVAVSRMKLQQLLATQDYTRESLEKR